MFCHARVPSSWTHFGHIIRSHVGFLCVQDSGSTTNDKPLEDEKIVKRSSLSFVKCEEHTEDIQEYWRKAL